MHVITNYCVTSATCKQFVEAGPLLSVESEDCYNSVVGILSTVLWDVVVVVQ
jgi:hypothetical protein